MMNSLLMVGAATHHATPEHHLLRDVQILSLLCFMMRPNKIKMVLQILTGKGKSITIACLTSILTVSGLKVDIVTTNQLLAERDAQKMRLFFNLMGISTSTNFEDNQKTPK